MNCCSVVSARWQRPGQQWLVHCRTNDRKLALKMACSQESCRGGATAASWPSSHRGLPGPEPPGGPGATLAAPPQHQLTAKGQDLGLFSHHLGHLDMQADSEMLLRDIPLPTGESNCSRQSKSLPGSGTSSPLRSVGKEQEDRHPPLTVRNAHT